MGTGVDLGAVADTRGGEGLAEAVDLLRRQGGVLVGVAEVELGRDAVGEQTQPHLTVDDGRSLARFARLVGPEAARRILVDNPAALYRFT